MNSVVFHADGAQFGRLVAFSCVRGASDAGLAAVPAASTTPQRARCAYFGIREWARLAPGLFASAAGCSKQLAVEPLECLGRPVVGAQSQDQSAPALDDPACAVDQLLYHRLDAPAFGRVAHRCIRPQQAALAHQAQDVHRQRRELAHKVVGVELARRQPLQVQVGLELGVELLVCAVVGVQRDDLLGVERLCTQAGAPAFEVDLGNDQLLAVSVNGALDQPEHATQWSADVFDLQGLFPHRHALAFARLVPLGVGVDVQPRQQRGAVHAAWVPLDQPVHLRLPGLVAGLDAAHQRDRVEAGVQPRQDRRLRSARAQALGHRDHSFEVEVGLTRRVLHARAQRQFQAEAVCAQIGRQRAVAVHPGVGAPHAFLARAAVVHREGVHVQRQPAAGQHAVVGPLAAQQPLNHPGHMLEQGLGLPVQALAQRWARRQQPYAQRFLEKLVTPVVLHRVEVALALRQQPQVAAQHVAVAHAGAHRQRPLQRRPLRPQRLQVVAHQGQPANGRQVVIQLLDFDSAHRPIVGRPRQSQPQSRTQLLRSSPAGCAVLRGGATDSGWRLA
mmetsp:Transcript_21056/g.81512  ORF Transcript_21056/g.81512 Transcript_21056/m.81512 type:complete len:560 (-) Transcript_21056:10102-11781(-)